MTRPIRAIVDLEAFRHNYRYAKACAPGALAIAVIKANGYGHGAVPLARALGSEADAFAVACLEEACELRESGIARPILLLEGVFHPDEYGVVDRLGLSVVIHDPVQIDWLQGTRLSRPLDCWLKIDTGMHRLGVAPARAAPLFERLSASAQCAEIVLMTHFARADETESDMTRLQLERFSSTVGDIPAPRSLSNSAATLAWPASHADWIRPGIMLYGASPLLDDEASRQTLRPVMRFESALIAVRELSAGESVGYGGRFVCEEPTRVGVVACGYADGYPRHAIDGTPVAVCGRPTRIIGRVSMDMLTVDLSEIERAGPGDPVELWGQQIPANEVASACGTIAYELFTKLTRRVPLVYEGH